MVTASAKVFALVISAIKNLCELKGSTSREILHYLSAVYNIPPMVARRQMQTALKRGVTYGILKKNGGHYVLPTSSAMKLQEIAEQEVNLLDSCRKSKIQRKMGCKCKSRRRKRRRRKRTFCRCKRKRARRRRRSSRGCRTKRRRRRKRKCRCGGLGSKGDRNRMKRPVAPQSVEPFSTEKSYDQPLEAYDSPASDVSSGSNVSSVAD